MNEENSAPEENIVPAGSDLPEDGHTLEEKTPGDDPVTKDKTTDETATASPSKSSPGRTAKEKSSKSGKKAEAEHEVTNVKVTQKVGKVRLEWELDSKGVSHIEVLGRYRKDRNFWKLEGYPSCVRAVEYDLLPLAPIEIRIHLVFRNGAWSKGVTVKTHALHKNVVEDEVEGRTIHVYLPDGYNDEDTYYPAIYMHDGQNLFCEKLAYVEHWMIDTAIERLVREGRIEKAVVVGIFNSSKRAEEYTPFADRRFGGGKARDFSQFVIEKIIPHVENRYRVSPKREDRAVMGSSFGGILSLWMGYAYPEYFSMVGAISPSLWVADGAMLEELRSQPTRNIKIWIDQGTGEWSTFTRNAVNILLQKGYRYGSELVYYEVKDAPHNEVAWAARVDCPFILFKGKPTSKCLEMRLDVQHIRLFNVGPTEVIINPIGVFDNGMWYSLYTSAEYSIKGSAPEADEQDGEKNPGDTDAPQHRKVTATIDCTGVLQFNEDRIATVVVKYQDLTKTVEVRNPNPTQKPSKKRLKSVLSVSASGLCAEHAI